MIMFESEIANLYTAAIMVFAALVPVLNPFGGAMFFSDADQRSRSSYTWRNGQSYRVVLADCVTGLLVRRKHHS